jgi:hypothetical protein
MSYSYNARKKAIKHGDWKSGKRNKNYVSTTVETMEDGSIKKTVIDEDKLNEAIKEG